MTCCCGESSTSLLAVAAAAAAADADDAMSLHVSGSDVTVASALAPPDDELGAVLPPPNMHYTAPTSHERTANDAHRTFLSSRITSGDEKCRSA